MHRVLEGGGLDAAGVDDPTALAIFRDMVRARRFDERALALQRRGWMSGYPPFRGQEASQVGAAHAMADEDWLAPTYRSNAMLLALGVDMADLLLFRRGFGEYRRGDWPAGVLPQAVPIATQIPHAVGIGMAARYRGGDHAVVCYLGDGATSEGDFHEGLNFAGVFESPTLFFCENNHWAISVPEGRQTASETLAQKAEAYGFPGRRVDGTDPFAVYDLVGATLSTVRDGRPHLLESLTYRHGPHTTADDPGRYRERSAVDQWRRRDPLERAEAALRDAGVLDDEALDAIESAVEAELEAAIETAEAAEPLEPGEPVDHLFETASPRLRRQREAIEAQAACRDRETDG
ncbi:MAG: thiamine pyrophosphate-dependent enzyme [Halobacteriales archaeon]